MLLKEIGLIVCQLYTTIRLALRLECDKSLQDRVANCKQIIRHEEEVYSFLNALIDAFGVSLTDSLKCFKDDVLQKVVAEWPLALTLISLRRGNFQCFLQYVLD